MGAAIAKASVAVLMLMGAVKSPAYSQGADYVLFQRPPGGVRTDSRYVQWGISNALFLKREALWYDGQSIH